MPSVRYVSRGLIDGSLSILGVVLGAAVGGDVKVIIAAGLGGGIANCLSNVFGALTAERAAIMADLKKTEEDLVGSDVRLKDTKIYTNQKNRILQGGALDGLFTFIGSTVPIAPFLLVGRLVDLETAILLSVAVTLLLLFVLGVYLGKLSKENILISGSKLALFGLITAIIASSLEFFFR
ncbi:MAG: TIGR00267 family protein [Candidatus Altiarchaeota archaeon]|nr:TIGR00267 family protein [Candidatus Altiarchaeota archaeon]